MVVNTVLGTQSMEKLISNLYGGVFWAQDEANIYSWMGR